MLSKEYIELAVSNIARFGDTDIFPYPIENYIFFDRKDEVIKILEGIDKDFNSSLVNYPVLYVKSLSVVGYNGFRASTQIDPLWNAYLLALTISLGAEIEKTRLATERNIVFSYRFSPNTETFQLFNPEIGWRSFQETTVERARECSFVLKCDISDFYPRVYHHRLENALKKASQSSETIQRIMLILTRLSDGVSSGLPVGGPAARLLSELLLNRVDRLLSAAGIPFCRFVDDFYVFATSKEQAYEFLVTMSTTLLDNEGLSLQKMKTRIMTRDEFLATSDFAEESQPETESEREAREFLRLRLRYDPYSPTAETDYEALQGELDRFDVVGMLAREVRKTRIDESLTRQLVRAIRLLDPAVQDDAICSLIDNLPTLYPVFTSVMLVIKSLIDQVSSRTQEIVFEELRALLRNGSYITQVPANLAHTLRLLSHDPSDETDAVLAELYKKSEDSMIKRDIILIMAQRNADYWISDCRKKYSVLSPWERRALVVASYILEDEGAHWRKSISKELSKFDSIVAKWAADKKQSKVWDLPL